MPALNINIPVLPALAALSIAYAFGEGLGRLACISFGCCYGKPVSLCHPALRRIFEHWSFIFSGKTKGIAYASNLDGEKVIPVQGITAVVYISTALLGVLFFINSLFTSSRLQAVGDWRGVWIGGAALVFLLAGSQEWQETSDVLPATAVQIRRASGACRRR